MGLNWALMASSVVVVDDSLRLVCLCVWARRFIQRSYGWARLPRAREQEKAQNLCFNILERVHLLDFPELRCRRGVTAYSERGGVGFNGPLKSRRNVSIAGGASGGRRV